MFSDSQTNKNIFITKLSNSKIPNPKFEFKTKNTNHHRVHYIDTENLKAITNTHGVFLSSP